MQQFVRYCLVGSFLIAGLTIGAVSTADAQNLDGDVGIGGQIGEPSGITLKVHNEGGMSYEFLGAFDLDDFFYLNVHGLFENPISDDEAVNLFYGPGGFIGIYDRPHDDDDDIALGISGRVGINFYVEQFELYAQVTPRIEVIPETAGDVGGGIGFRYYF